MNNIFRITKGLSLNSNKIKLNVVGHVDKRPSISFKKKEHKKEQQKFNATCDT